jgi:hypothetical protein
MTQPLSPQAELHYRLSDALGSHDPDPDEAAQVREAYMAAGMDNATWDDLAPDIQALIMGFEALPRTGWSDPIDVPEDTPDDF